MLKDQRLDKITEIVMTENKVSVMTLAEMLDVTPETIRKDLSELEENKKVSRVHGAAIPYQSSSKELFFDKKLAVNQDEKRTIARKAAMLIESGDMIAVNGGTTTVHIPDYFHDLHNIKAVTNSLAFAMQFNKAAEEGRVKGELILTPGVSYFEQNSVRGSLTVSFLSQCAFDKAFISCGGINDEFVSEYDLEEAEVSKIMVEQSDHNYILCDLDKFNKTRAFKVADISKFDAIISEEE